MSIHSATSPHRIDTCDDDTHVARRHVVRPVSEHWDQHAEPTPLRELLRTGLAACANTDLPPDAWFPSKGRSRNDAVLLCLTCPVRRQCDQVGQDELGVWGGHLHRSKEPLVGRGHAA